MKSQNSKRKMDKLCKKGRALLEKFEGDLLNGRRTYKKFYNAFRRFGVDNMDAEGFVYDFYFETARCARGYRYELDETTPINGRVNTWLWWRFRGFLSSLSRKRRREAMGYKISGDDETKGRIEDLASLEVSPETEIEKRELREGVERSLEKLPEDLSCPLVLYYFEGLNNREISKLYNLSESAISMRLIKAREMLSGEPLLKSLI